jgi:surface antigen
VYVPPPRQVTIVQPYVPPRIVSVIPPRPRIASTTCREYTTIVTIDGQTVPAYGRACLQPDGSWQLIPIE